MRTDTHWQFGYLSRYVDNHSTRMLTPELTLLCNSFQLLCIIPLEIVRWVIVLVAFASSGIVMYAQTRDKEAVSLTGSLYSPLQDTDDPPSNTRSTQ